MRKPRWHKVAVLFAGCIGVLVLAPTVSAQGVLTLAPEPPAGRTQSRGMLVVEAADLHAVQTVGGGALVLAVPAPGKASRVAGNGAVYDALIQRAAERYGMDADLLHAVIRVESNYDPQAISPKGAIGLMQIMPATGMDLGFSNPQHDLLIPANNIDAGARQLAWLMRRFDGDLQLALAAYNAGAGAVSRYKGALPNYPETRKYVSSVLAWYQGSDAGSAQLEAR
ncbi:Transglycosylase SLT domain-containing protein [Bordetella muralis]